MDYQKTYENYWEKIIVGDKFEDYERNLILDDFFPITQAGSAVADIAGGAGIVAEWLMKRGYDVTLVEFSDEAIKLARERGINKIVNKKIESGVNLSFADNSFDSVFFGDIIEHLFDPESIMNELRRVLKPGGKLILSCPNVAYWRFRFYYLLDGDFQRIDSTGQKPWEQMHIRFYNIWILKEFLGKLGFEFGRFKGTNKIWHSRILMKYFPNLFAHTIVAEFKNKK